MIPAGISRDESVTTYGRPRHTWVHPDIREIVAETFSDHDLLPPTPEEVILSRRAPDLDDAADEYRYADSLIASRARRRTRTQATAGDYAMRVVVPLILAATVFVALNLFGIAIL